MFRKMSKQILRSYIDTIFDFPQPLHSLYIVWLGLDRSQKNDYPPYNSQKEDWNDFRGAREKCIFQPKKFGCFHLVAP